MKTNSKIAKKNIMLMIETNGQVGQFLKWLSDREADEEVKERLKVSQSHMANVTALLYKMHKQI